MINDPLKYVAVPYAELQALLEMARNVSKNSPWGQSATQPWNPEIKQLPELGSEVPTIAGIVGESNTILISMPDYEAIKALMPYVGTNNNWWINGIDTGISAVPDSSSVIRPHIVVEQPVITATANVDEVFITGGKVTVFSDTTHVNVVDVQDATVNVLNKPMLVVSSAGVVTALDSTAPVINAVPVFYINHTVSGTVESSEITAAVLASELCYYAQILKQLDITNLNNLNATIENGLQAVNGAVTTALQTLNNSQVEALQTVQDLVDSLDASMTAAVAQSVTRLLGVPRILSFCHINDYDYISGNTIAYYVADHNFTFPVDFAESQAAFTLKTGFLNNPEVALIAIYVNNSRIGSIQIGTDDAVTFVMYMEGTTIEVGDQIKFKVDSMNYISSLSVSMVHYLGV